MGAHALVGSAAAPPALADKLRWKFVDRASEETEALLQSLLQMSQVNGDPRKEALGKLVELVTEKPPSGPRVVMSLMSLRGLSTMVSALNAPCAASRLCASTVLQEAVAYGHATRVSVECPNWFFAVRRNLESDVAETRVSGAGLLRCMPPTAECMSAIPLLLRSLKVEAGGTREECAGALLQLTRDAACLDEMASGAGIGQCIQNFRDNGSHVVRQRCAAILAVLSRASRKHRLKIVQNDGVHVLLEALSPTASYVILDCVLRALQNMCLEEQARFVFSHVRISKRGQPCTNPLSLADKLVDIINSGSKVKQLAFEVLATFNNTPEGVNRESLRSIGELTSTQECKGLAKLFAHLPTACICWRIRRVSRCWRRVTALHETWMRVNLDFCAFMSSHKLRSLLATAPLQLTEVASFVGCNRIDADGFQHLAAALKSKLRSLDMSQCQNLKDEALITLLKTSEGTIDTLRVANCGLLSDASIYGIVAHLSTSLRVLELNHCTWLRDDAIMLLSSACRSLKCLGIGECSGLTAECLTALSYAVTLEELDLSLNGFVSDEGLAHIARNVTGLTSLDISGCGRVTDKGAECFASLSQMRVLDVSGNMLLTDASVRALAAGCAQLTSLKCMMIPALSGQSVQMLVAKCAHLRVLDLSYMALMTDVAMRSITRICKGLIELNIAWCESISASGFGYISEFCRALERLNVSSTLIGDAEVWGIIEQCRSIRHLCIADCRRLSAAMVQSVLEKARSETRFLPVAVVTGLEHHCYDRTHTRL